MRRGQRREEGKALEGGESAARVSRSPEEAGGAAAAERGKGGQSLQMRWAGLGEAGVPGRGVAFYSKLSTKPVELLINILNTLAYI